MTRSRTRALALGLALAAAAPAATSFAEEKAVEARAVEYRDGDVVLEGWMAKPKGAAAPAPGVVVVHEWWGLGRHAKAKAEELAGLGYVAFALDMFGKGKLTTDPKQAGSWAGEFRGEENREKVRRRAAAGLAVLAKEPGVDAARVAAIGFCFGGTVALEMGYSEANLRAVVCFHGNPVAPAPRDGPVKPAVLVCHGADDPMVKPEALRAFEEAMKAAKADWQLVQYGGAVHSFTNPDAKGDLPGAKYDARAAARSWDHMRSLFEERLRR